MDMLNNMILLLVKVKNIKKKKKYTTLSYLFQNLIEKFVETNKIYIPSKDLKKKGWGHIGMGGYT